MEFIQQILKEQGPKLAGVLMSKLGFSSGQADGFLGGALKQISGLISGGGLKVTELFGGGGVGALLSKLNFGQLASEAGVDEGKARQGMEEVAPSMLSSLKDAVDSPEDLLGKFTGEGVGGVLGKVGGLFKK